MAAGREEVMVVIRAVVRMVAWVLRWVSGTAQSQRGASTAQAQPQQRGCVVYGGFILAHVVAWVGDGCGGCV